MKKNSIQEQLLNNNEQLSQPNSANKTDRPRMEAVHQINADQDDDSEDEDDLRTKQELRNLNDEIKRNKEMNQANNKVVVGSGFGFDMTQFFRFKKDIKSTGNDVKTVFDHLSGGHLAWVILIYSVCNAAMIPAWIMNIKATKLMRISWRFLLQAMMMIPFVLYEYRIAVKKGNTATLEKYKLSYIFSLEHFQIAYISSFATSFWFTMILTIFQWIFISQTMFLGALANYFLSFGRSSRGKAHDLEPGGQVLITIGIIIVLIDIYNLDPSLAHPDDWNYINPFYLTRNRFQAILAGLAALGVSYGMSKFSVFTDGLKNHYPPYLSMFLVNLLVCINMMFSTFFFNGATFDMDPSWGILSIFSQQHFAAFMYMAIILCMGLVISFVMISNLFPEHIIPSLAMTFEPAISTLLVYLAGVQNMPNSLSFVGYILIIPGNFLILIGQWIFQQANKKKQEQNQIRMTKLQQQVQKRQKSLIKISESESEYSRQSIPAVRSGSLMMKENNVSPDLNERELHSEIRQKPPKRSLHKKLSIEMKQFKRSQK